jgi:ABC-2 type transport system permease protein
MLVVHLGLLGLIGVFLMAGSMSTPPAGAIVPIKPTVGVVDRDHSELSQALARHLRDHGTLVEIGQQRRDLQDAAALGEAAYIAVIPAGYQDAFVMAAGRNHANTGGDGGTGTDGIGHKGQVRQPLVETVATLESAQGRYMDQLANSFLRLVRAGLLAAPEEGLGEALQRAERISSLAVEQSVVARSGRTTDTQRFGYYMAYAAYPLTAGVLVLTGLMVRSFQVGEIRRRNLAAPVPPGRTAAQLGLAGAVVCVAGWVWVTGLSLFPAAGGMAVLTGASSVFALAAAATLVYAVVPLAMGFMGAQLGMGGTALNGFGTIGGLAFAFLGGLFTAGVETTGAMAAIGQFTPTHWHLKAIDATPGLTHVSWESLAAYLGPLGMELLFAAAFAALGLVAGRMRRQTAESGGLPLDSDE